MAYKLNASATVIGWSTFLVVFLGAGIAWFALDPGFRDPAKSSVTTDRMPQDDFERRVHDYIMDNPEVLLAAVQKHRERQEAAELGAAQTVLRARLDEISRDPDSPVGGNPDGDVTLVEFFDYNCPYCRRVAPVMADLERDDTQLRIVYKEFPVLGANSMFAAKAALAAHEQGKYVAFHHALIRLDGAVDETAVMAVAQQSGLDVARLRVDMESQRIESAIERNRQLAQDLRITGTPSFVVGEEIHRGATDLATLRSLIVEARESRTEQ